MSDERGRQGIDALVAFCNELDDLYGLFVDVAISTLRYSESTAKMLKHPSHLDASFIYGRGALDDPSATFQHVTTNRELIERNSRNGRNSMIMARSIIVLIYMLWEDQCRGQLAGAIAIDKNDVKSAFFSDLKKYRHAITHNKGVLDRNTETLSFVERGSSINLTSDDVYELFELIYSELNKLAKLHLKINLGREFNKAGRQHMVVIRSPKA